MRTFCWWLHDRKKKIKTQNSAKKFKLNEKKIFYRQTNVQARQGICGNFDGNVTGEMNKSKLASM